MQLTWIGFYVDLHSRTSSYWRVFSVNLLNQFVQYLPVFLVRKWFLSLFRLPLSFSWHCKILHCWWTFDIVKILFYPPPPSPFSPSLYSSWPNHKFLIGHLKPSTRESFSTHPLWWKVFILITHLLLLNPLKFRVITPLVPLTN